MCTSHFRENMCYMHGHCCHVLQWHTLILYLSSTLLLYSIPYRKHTALKTDETFKFAFELASAQCERMHLCLVYQMI
jgi:hypothetical protein